MAFGLYTTLSVANIYSYKHSKNLESDSVSSDKFSVNGEIIIPKNKFIIDSIAPNTEYKFIFKFLSEVENFYVKAYYARGYSSPYPATTDNVTITSQSWNNDFTELTIILTSKVSMTSSVYHLLFTIDSSAPQPPTTKYKLLITGRIENADCNYTNNEEISADKNIIITSHNGYYWNDITYPLNIQPSDYKSFIISNNKKLLNFPIPASLNGNIDLYSDYIAMLEKPTEYKIIISGTIKNAVCNYSNGEIIDINTKPRLIITADTGFYFTDRNYSLTVNNISDTYFDYSNTTLTYDLTSTNLNADIELDDNYIANKSVIKVSEFNYLYEITSDELSQLASERFVVNNKNTIDYGIFINSLYKLPFKINTDLIGIKENVKLGNLTSNVQSAIITQDILQFTLPNIICTEKYHNIYDYKNAKAVLHAPFFEPIDLDIRYVMDCTLSIAMSLNLYTNKMGIFVKSSFNNLIIHFSEVTLGVNIPFATANYNFINKKDISFNPNVTSKMRLEISRKKPLTSNLKYHSTKVYDSLNKYSGYISVENLELVTQKATDYECDKIDTLLSQGVFINK